MTAHLSGAALDAYAREWATKGVRVARPAAPTRPPIIGLVGKKRAGKDTVAETLTSEFGFVRYAFADPLKATMLDLDPWVVSTDDGGVQHTARLSGWVASRGWEGAKEHPEVRRLLQAHGVAIRTHVSESVWVDATMSRVMDETRPVVVTDVRFPNEADTIEAAGGVLVRVHRPSLVSEDEHVSETALDERLTPWHIYNEGGLAELKAAATDLAGRALGWWQ